MLTEILALGTKILDKLFQDPQEKAQKQLEFAQLVQNGEFKEQEMRYEDIANARGREIAVKDKMPAILAILITLGFFGILLLVMSGICPSSTIPAADIMLGSLGTAWVSVVTYYFGTSASSQKKDVHMAAIMDNLSKGNKNE